MLALLAVCFFSFFAGLGACPLLDPGDGYFAEGAREMLERADYVVPYLNGQIYFSKPVMIYWLIIGAYKSFGVSEFAARFPSAVLATISVLLTFMMGRKIAGPRAGFLAGIVLAASPFFCTFGRMCLVDMAFSTFLTGALTAFVFSMDRPENKSWPWIYVALAGAVLTKGPAALVLAGATVVLFSLLQRQNPFAIVRPLHVLPGVAILAALVVPWFYAVGLATDWLWPKVFLLFENVDRFNGHTNHINHNPFYYLLVLAYGFMPWTIVAPLLMTGLKEKLIANRPTCLLLCWTIVVVGAFSASVTKLQTYVLPVFAPSAVLLGVSLAAWATRIENGRFRHLPKSFTVASFVMTGIGAGLFLLSFALFAGLALNYFPFPSDNLPDGLKFATALAALCCSVIAVGQGCLYARRAHSAWFKSFIAANCAVVALTVGVVFEVAYDFMQRDLNVVIEPLKHLDWKNKDVAIFEHFKPSVMFYLHHSVDSFFQPTALEPVPAGEQSTQYLLVPKRRKELLLAGNAQRFELVNESGRWLLFKTSELKLRKLPTLETTFRAGTKLSMKGAHWGTLPFAGSGKTL